MSTKIFVNLPVADLTRSREFFTKLGYSFNPQFSDENAACLVISDDIYAMLLLEPFFRSFSHKDTADATTSSEMILALAVDSRDRVDELADRAIAAGGHISAEVMDQGGMYVRSFQDLDGHLWEVLHMDTSATQG